MPFVEIDHARVHYAAHKSGQRAVIFLHGGFGSSSELWATTMAALPPGWSGYAIDNFLRSDAPPDGYNVNAFAKRTAGFIAALGLERPILVGHSMGGVVCQLTALLYPERVGGLVLTCTGAHMTNHNLARELLEELRRNGGDRDNLRAISANWFHRTPGAFFEGYVDRAASAPLRAMIDVQESLIATDLREKLPHIEAPTLVVFGAHDTGRTMDHAQTLLDGIPGSKLAAMKDSGHSPMVETPETYNAALREFLTALTPMPVSV
jgi:pimeloyl-ACP methyl ester carboxylesterase